MINTDIVNSVFQLGCAVAAFNNVVTLHKQKKVRGVSPLSVIWFLGFGLWNIYFFKEVNQMISVLASWLVVAGNLMWISQITYYNMKEARSLKGENAMTYE